MDKKKSKTNKISLFFKIAGIIFFCIVATTYFLWVEACGPADSYGTGHTERVEIPSGMTVKQAAHLLKEKKLINNELVFYLAARYPFLDKSEMTGLQTDRFILKSGVYNISSESGLSDIFHQLSSGSQEYIKVTIPEGYTSRKIALKLEEEGVCLAGDFLSAVKSSELLQKYKIASDSFEGYLYPDTYNFTPDMSGEAVVSFMADNFFDKIHAIESFFNLTSEELNNNVILASIVEKEYQVASEAPLIASVFKNRLKRNIGLYSCATIEYIITEIEGKPHPTVITTADTKIDSPYNTYKWAGLPPAAISNPGFTALKAVADTPKTGYYYFRLTDPEKGTHSFSADFETHISEGQLLYTKKISRK